MISINPVVVTSPPFADLYISGLPVGTARVEVTRQWRGVSRRVRGDSQAVVLGTGVRVVDWALPVSVDAGVISYVVSAVSAAGAVLEVSAAVEVTAPPIGHSEAWVSDPHDPMTAQLVSVMAVDGEQGDAAVQTVTTMTGLPVALNAPRVSRGRPWRISVDAWERVRDVDALLGVGTDPSLTGTGILLVRCDPSCIQHATGLLYVTAPSVTRDQLLPHEPRTDYSWSGIETRGPAAPVAVSRRTYQDDLDENPTYAASLAAYPTYLDRVRAGL